MGYKWDFATLDVTLDVLVLRIFVTLDVTLEVLVFTWHMCHFG